MRPILIKNVNYGNTSSLSYLSDTTSQYIPVPCGHCSSCVNLRQQYILQRCQMEAFDHDFYMLSITYNQESLPIHEVGDYRLAYVDFSDWQKMLKMIRKYEDLPKFRYLVVTEYGGKRHRPHLHAVLSFPRTSDCRSDKVSMALRLHRIFLKYWRRNYGSSRSPVWKPLLTYKRTRRSWNYDLHYVDPWLTKGGINDVAFYVSKYCLKHDEWYENLQRRLYMTLDEDDYKEARSLLHPKIIMSKGFGDPLNEKVITHIRKGIDFAIDDPMALYPYFLSPVNGTTFPLAPYYRSRYLMIRDLEVFNARKPCLTDYDMMTDSTPLLTPEEVAQREIKHSAILSELAHRHNLFDDEYQYENYEKVEISTPELLPDLFEQYGSATF